MDAAIETSGLSKRFRKRVAVQPIDLTVPSAPKQLSDPWTLQVHDCSISDDGRRGYFTTYMGEMLIVDTSPPRWPA